MLLGFIGLGHWEEGWRGNRFCEKFILRDLSTWRLKSQDIDFPEDDDVASDFAKYLFYKGDEMASGNLEKFFLEDDDVTND